LFAINAFAAYWKQRAAQLQRNGHYKQYNAARGVGAKRTGVELVVGCTSRWIFSLGKAM